MIGLMMTDLKCEREPLIRMRKQKQPQILRLAALAQDDGGGGALGGMTDD